jgi:hypothetical protein
MNGGRDLVSAELFVISLSSKTSMEAKTLALRVFVSVRIDAIPERSNGTWYKAATEGVFYGECSKLRSKDHARQRPFVHADRCTCGEPGRV